MPTGTRDPMLHTGAMVTMCDLQGIRDSGVGLRRCLPITAGREIRLKLNAKPALLLLAVLLVIPGVGLSFTPDAAAQQGSATSVNEAAGHGKAVPGSSPGEIPEQEEHGLPQKAVEIARPFGFPITNSMLVSWIVALGLIVFAQLATRNMKRVPEGAQNFLEWLVEGLYRVLEGILGRHLTERTFWFFATIFIFIVVSNWVGLIPGVGTVGWGRQTAQGFKIDQPFFRGVNADVNMTFAMALVFFACWIVWAIQEVGLRGFLKELFAPKGESTGPLKILLMVVFFAAGCLEIISILFRPISLSFRLYGNIFAGENMLEAMARLVPGFGWLIPIPFYFLELLMGLVQALVFMLLTAVFTLLICQHEGESAGAHH